MTWLLEIGQGPLRAYIGPMDGRGAPYRMTITTPEGASALFVGLPTVARAVEAFCTVSSGAGQAVPAGARAEWNASAARLDDPKGPVN